MATHPDTDSLDGAATSGGAQQRVADRWVAFQAVREDLAEVMNDDDLREFGINVEVLDEEP